MSLITRRKALQSLGIASVAGQMACEKECADLLIPIVFLILIGKTIQSALEYAGLWVERLPNRKGQVTTKPNGQVDLSGAISASTGGPAPPGSPGPPGKNAIAFPRAFYAADNLGDATVDGRVFAIDLTQGNARLRGSVTLRAAMPSAPALSLPDIALSPDGARLLVCQAGPSPEWIFIDAASLTISQRMTPPPGIFPRQAVFSPDGKLAYTFSSDLQFDNTAQRFTVHVLDAVTRTVLNSLALPAGTAIDDLAITPDGALLFAVGSRSVHVIDTATFSYSGQNDIVTPTGPFVSGNVRRLAMHPNGDRLYTVIMRFPAGATVPVVAAIDTRTAQVVSEWPLRYPTGGTAPRLVLSPDGSTLGAGFQRGTELQMYDTTAGEPLPSIAFEGNASFSDAVSV